MLKALRLWRYVDQSHQLHSATVKRIEQAVPSMKEKLWLDPYVMSFFEGLWQPFLLRWTHQTGAALSAEDVNYIFLRSYSKATDVAEAALQRARIQSPMSVINAQRMGLLQGLAMGHFLITQNPVHIQTIQTKVDEEFSRVREAGQLIQRESRRPEDDAEIYRACIMSVTLGEYIMRVLELGSNPLKA